jgi:subtilisin family serine protease
MMITFSVLSSSPQFASAKAGSEKVRVIAESEDKAAEAVAHGCDIVRETKGLRALVCSSEVASKLGLQEDIKVFAVDTGANSQIGADTVQSGGDTGLGRKIVVLDTGYNYFHAELSSSYGGGKDFVNNDNDPMDDNGHGSHVAGLITGDGVVSNTKGVAPDATIIAGKVLASSGSGYFSDIVAAVYWAVDGPDGISGTSDDFGADAISMSIGTSPPYTYKGTCDNVMPSMTNAIKYARDMGVLVVVAAGNSGNSGVSIPGCISYSTTVGAVNSSDKIASFSGRGKAVDIVAPGVSLLSAWTGTSYVSASGTSMATPVVSGTVALIKYEHPGNTPSQTESVLFNTAKDLGKSGKDTTYGYGRINASAAAD